MECVTCGTGQVNRLIIDESTDRVHGGVCDTCEVDMFGSSLKEAWTTPGECLYCQQTGEYKLPRIDLLIESEADGRLLDYEVESTDAALCSEHQTLVATAGTASGEEPQRTGAQSAD